MPVLTESDGRELVWDLDNKKLTLAYQESSGAARFGTAGNLGTIRTWPEVSLEAVMTACQLRYIEGQLDGGKDVPSVLLDMPADTRLANEALELIADHNGLEPADLEHYTRFGHDLREAMRTFRIVNRIPRGHPLYSLKQGRSPHSAYLLPILWPVFAMGRAVVFGLTPLAIGLLVLSLLCFVAFGVFRNLAPRTATHELLAFIALIVGFLFLVGLVIP